MKTTKTRTERVKEQAISIYIEFTDYKLKRVWSEFKKIMSMAALFKY